MASLSDVLSAVQNGVIALNNLTIQMKGSLLNIFGQLSTDAANIATNTTDISSTIGEISALNGLQINGSMDVSQELGGTGTSTHNTYILDGWTLFKNGPMVCTAFQQSSVTTFNGFSNYLAITVGTAEAALGATDYISVLQHIEGYRAARLNFGTAYAKPVTIGFWTAHHRVGLYSGSIRNSAINRFYPFSYTQAVADTAQFNTVTIPGDVTGTWLTTNGMGLSIVFVMASGSTYLATAGEWTTSVTIGVTGQVNGVAATSDVFRITGVILLQGDKVPTAAQSPYIMRPFDVELAICQRYFQKSYDYTVAPGSISNNGVEYLINDGYMAPGSTHDIGLRFHSRMRAAPSVTTYSPNSGATAKAFDPVNVVDLVVGQNAAGEAHIVVYASVGVTQTTQISFHWKADARL